MDALTIDVLKLKYPQVYYDMTEEFKKYMDTNAAIQQENIIIADLQLNTVGIEGAYSSFIGSPASKGILQFDMWGEGEYNNDRYDWDDMKLRIVSNGIRHSLLVAPMPTASTSQILGNNECFEPVTSNIYMRRTMAGEFMVINKFLMRELIALDLWNDKLKQNIIANGGSIQQLDFISEEMRLKYRTVWEIPMKHLINMARDRGKYICQSQSLNLWMEDPDYSSLTAMHFYSWSQGLKTGIYYLRRKARHQPQQFTVEPDASGVLRDEQEYEICEMCSG
jgi:ribonucleotide reductase alpha subunit